jgi:hypothetical protein
MLKPASNLRFLESLLQLDVPEPAFDRGKRFVVVVFEGAGLERRIVVTHVLHAKGDRGVIQPAHRAHPYRIPQKKRRKLASGFRKPESNARSRRAPEIVSGKRCRLVGQLSKTQKVNERSILFEDYQIGVLNWALQQFVCSCPGSHWLK